MDNINVRSEEVRRIIRQPLPPLLRWGTVGVAVVVALLLLAAFLCPLPGTGGGEGNADGNPSFVERLWQPNQGAKDILDK